MSNDLTRLAESLRLHAFDDCNESVLPTHLCNIAADTITALQADLKDLRAEMAAATDALATAEAENARLREALESIAAKCRTYEHINLVGRTGTAIRAGTLRNCLFIAHEALEENKP